MTAARPAGRESLLRLDGRRALVTGGSRGIGRAIAQAFVDAGARVVLVARRADVLERTRSELAANAPGRVEARPCDVGDGKEIGALCEWLRASGEPVDILVNNAGASNQQPFERLSDEEWQHDLDVKLLSAIRLARAVLPGMKDRRWGRIINVTSINGKTPPTNGAPSCVARAAGIALTKLLANEFASYNVLVNALCTGIIMSDQMERRHAASGRGGSLDEFVQAESARIPLGRIGTAEEYASVALFLASEAGSYVTGTAINVDGGLCRAV